MLFNSFEFLLFLPTVFLLYWFVFNKGLKWQNLFLLVVSYIFYGWWDWRFLSLIFFSSFIDYNSGLLIEKSKSIKKKKIWLSLSIVVNIGFLAVFKYFNFFSESLAEGFEKLGWHIDNITLNVILPVGISFYTFQTMSYTIDVYKAKIKPTKDPIAFFAFVSFFPQLVAGPIERATNLLPQFYNKRQFMYNRAADGMRQILWGLFKKMVVADNAAIVVNQVFSNYTEHTGSELFVGVIFFAFQIYGDFSGYSDIAIGTARLFGFDLKQNFAFPYFSRDIAEFWRRWHLSLSTWFRDYVYIPLGGSRGGKMRVIRNIFIIFVVSGFWHGANWTFIVWGALNAVYFLPLLLFKSNRKHLDTVAKNSLFPNLKELLQIGVTFFLTVLAWVFFRAPSLTDAIMYIRNIFSLDFFSIPKLDLKSLLFIAIMLMFEWFHREQKHGLEVDYIKKPFYRWGLYLFLFCVILIFGSTAQSFIYFQF